MPKAGLCAQCQENVWLTVEGACPNGHDASQISNVYEAEAPSQDAFAQAANDIENAASQAGDALGEAWDNASPAAKEAADAAGEAATKAAEAAKGFGKKLWGSAKKQGSSDTGMDMDLD